jgi:TrwC relaxase
MSLSLAKAKVRPEIPAEDIVTAMMEQVHGEPADMMWHTTEWAAVQLGIAGPGQRLSQQAVRRSTLRALLAGRHPVSMEPIGRTGRDGTRVAALTVVVAAPRSVSILWAFGEGDVPQELELMVAQASDRAVMRMLREQPLVRRRDPGRKVENVRARDYVAVSGLHTTGPAEGQRVPDPHLHVRYLLIGDLEANGDRLRALDPKVLLTYRAELEAEASGHLAEMVRQRGFEIDRRQVDRPEGPRVSWEVAGVPRSLIETMDARSEL